MDVQVDGSAGCKAGSGWPKILRVDDTRSAQREPGGGLEVHSEKTATGWRRRCVSGSSCSMAVMLTTRICKVWPCNDRLCGQSRRQHSGGFREGDAAAHRRTNATSQPRTNAPTHRLTEPVTTPIDGVPPTCYFLHAETCLQIPGDAGGAYSS